MLIQGTRIENALNGIGKVLSKIGEIIENQEESEEEEGNEDGDIQQE